MSIPELIQEKVSNLPKSLQLEILDFIEFVSSRSVDSTVINEDNEWKNYSLQNALRDMMDEDTTIYEQVKFIEKWK